MGATKPTTDATFDADVLKNSKPVLVDFWAEWCGPCKKLSPILEQIAEEMSGQVKVAKVDVDAERTLGAMFQVMSLPTVMIFKDGAAVDTLIGAQPKSEIVSRIHQHI